MSDTAATVRACACSDFERGQLEAIIASIDASRQRFSDRREELESASPRGLPSGDLHELLGYALGSIQAIRDSLSKVVNGGAQ